MHYYAWLLHTPTFSLLKETPLLVGTVITTRWRVRRRRRHGRSSPLSPPSRSERTRSQRAIKWRAPAVPCRSPARSELFMDYWSECAVVDDRLPNCLFSAGCLRSLLPLSFWDGNAFSFFRLVLWDSRSRKNFFPAPGYMEQKVENRPEADSNRRSMALVPFGRLSLLSKRLQCHKIISAQIAISIVVYNLRSCHQTLFWRYRLFWDVKHCIELRFFHSIWLPCMIFRDVVSLLCKIIFLLCFFARRAIFRRWH